MKLSLLLNDAGQTAKVKYTGKDMEITGITDDTRSIMPGSIFVCVKGGSFDGHDAAADMIAAGAAVVVCDRDLKLRDRQIIVEDTRRFYGLLCAAWFGHPEKRLKLVGVTGTNGKTTMATMIHAVLMGNRVKAGFIGTTGASIGNEPMERDESTPTTPKVFELYDMFSKMLRAGCTHVVMEVSSFASEQNRIGPARYKVCVFTNLTQDHLDYHKTMENYYLAKKRIFTDHCDCAFVNTEDEYGKRLFSEISCEKYSYGIKGGTSVYASDIKLEAGSSRFMFNLTGGSYPIAVKMIGSYNISNTVAAVGACVKLGLSVSQIQSALNNFNGVRGRCEIIPTGREFVMLCDYAHSPDALENMLSSIRENTVGRLICLFGCGGDRDRTKRPLMAKAAAMYSDYLIVTSDNPRSEDPDAIIDEILTGLEGMNVPYDRITDRKDAIFHAVRIAGKGDTVVLAGKGHEDYQIFADGVHVHFDEREVAAEALKEIPYFENKPTSDANGKLSLNEIALAVNGKLFQVTDPEKQIKAKDIFRDNRQVIKGGLFAAYKGERFDGHDFAEDAVNKGAAAALMSRVVSGVPSVLVKDTGTAVMELAAYYRRKFSPVVIGITGSVGKTTTKEMTALAVSSRYNTLKTEANHNNEIGMPFTLFRMTKEHTAAVIEMGMSHFGEIERMSNVCAPDICVITNIGESHMENLGSREGIMQAKLEILKGAKRNATLIVNGDDDMLFPLKAKSQAEGSIRPVITCGITNTGCDFRAENITSSGECTFFDITGGKKTVHAMIPCIGNHNVLDAVIAFAAAVTAGCDEDAVCARLKSFHLDGLRQHIEKKDGHTVVVDCYNAAPASMKAAIDVLCQLKKSGSGRHICVLGDMLELGDNSAALHAEVGEYAAVKGVDMVLCTGELSANIAEKASSLGACAAHFADKESLVSHLKDVMNKDDILLFKASRGMHFEEIINAVFGSEK